MRIIVTIDDKKYKLTYWKWLAYQNQRQLNRIEKKLDEILDKDRNQCTDKSSNNGDK